MIAWRALRRGLPTSKIGSRIGILAFFAVLAWVVCFVPVVRDLARISSKFELRQAVSEPSSASPAAKSVPLESGQSRPSTDDAATESGFSREVLEQREKTAAFLKIDHGSPPAATSQVRNGVMLYCSGIISEADYRECTYDAVAAASSLRATGSTLPITLAALGAVGSIASDLWVDYLFFHNISIVNPFTTSAAINASSNLRSEGSRFDLFEALTAVPFENVIVMDTRTISLKDPSFLFDRKEFLNKGSLFWTGIGLDYKDETRIVMQAILGRQTSRHLNIRVPVKPEGEIASEDSATFSSSVFILNRNVCWKAVQLGSHLSQSQIVSKLLFGEDSLLYWSFVGSKTPYYHEISPPALVGAVVGSKSPQGSSIITDDVVVYAPSGNRTSAPDDLQLCGQAVGYGDPFGAPQSLGRSSDTQQHRIAKVDTSSLLFVNWRSLGRYAKGLEHLRVAVSVDASAKRGSAAKVLFETEPRRGDFHSCRMFKQTSEERDSFQIVDLSQLHPKLNSNFHSHRNGARDENLAQKLKARRFRSSILPFEASLLPGVVDTSNPSVLFAQQVRKGTRGVVITGSGKHAHNVIMTTLLLRETGCKLPVEFLYMKGQVHEVELQWISSFNITTVDFAPLMKGFSEGWGREEWRLGAAKVFSILASSFEEVLFLDPDNYVLRDPTYLFETQTYRKHGSIFWPDFPVRKKGLAVWDILEMQGRFWKELEFETGQIVINKRASWRGLMMTVHISKESNFYFRHFLGDKEAFFWGYASSQTPYYLAPHYIHSVGLVVNDEFPRGNTKIGVDFQKTRFCGQSMLQSDFPDHEAGYEPRPLFMHWNMVKRNYKPDVNYFQSAMTYDFPKGFEASDYDNVNYHYSGKYYGLENCLAIKPIEGVKIRLWDWNAMHPGHNERFHKAYQITPPLGDFYRSRWRKFAAEIPAYSTKGSPTEGGKRGIIMVGSNDNMHNIVRTILLIRSSGSKLPIEVMYRPGKVIPEQVELLKKLDARPVNLTFAFDERNPEWTDWEYRQGTKIEAMLVSSFDDMLYLDASVDTILVRDPEFLFDTQRYKNNGGLFWQHFNARDSKNQLWEALELRNTTQDRSEMRFDPGQMVISKKRAWKALKLAEHMLTDGMFYSDRFQGEAEIFFWAFAATKTPYFLNPHFLSVLGLVVNKEFPKGRKTPSTLSPSPPDTIFCGSARMHADFEDSAVEAGGERHKRDAPGVSAPPKNSSITQNTTKGGISSPSALAPPSLFKPRPLFIHMDFMSDKGFQTDVDYFQNSVRWRLEGDPKEIRYWSGKVSPADFESAAYAEVGGFPGYKKCFSLKKVKGVEVILDEWDPNDGNVSEKYWHVYNRVK